MSVQHQQISPTEVQVTCELESILKIKNLNIATVLGML